MEDSIVYETMNDELVQHTEEKKQIENAPYYEIDDPVFAELHFPFVCGWTIFLDGLDNALDLWYNQI